MLWLSAQALSPEVQRDLQSRFASDVLNIRTWSAPLPRDTTLALRAILELAVTHDAQIISGEFDQTLAARLAKSQSQGGALAGYVLAFPGPDQYWEIMP